MSEIETEYGLLVSFPDESESYVNGFEAGQIWEAMSRSDPTVERTVHSSNETVLRRMAHVQGYALIWRDLGDGCWADFQAQKVTPARGTGDPIATGRFSVIEGGLAHD